MADNILTAANKPIWRGESIRKILTNEKYMGDALLQKTCTLDVLSKKRVINSGLVPQYYVENNHEAIVSKEMFHRVQMELKQRAGFRKNKENQSSTYSSKYILSNILFCKKCGNHYRRIKWQSKGNESIKWRCKSRVLNGVDCCDADSISEKEIQNFVVRAINKMLGSREDLLEKLKDNIEDLLDIDSLGITKIDKRMDELQLALEECIHQNKDFSGIIQKLDRLKKLKDRSDILEYNKEKDEDRIRQIKNFIETQSTLLSEYDEEIVRKLVKKVIIDNDEIEVIFQTEKSIKMKRFKK